MDEQIDPEETARRDEFDKHRAKFYELIGHCITLYQTIEDYLEDVFAAALRGEKDRAIAVFTVARGLEAKLNIITAALTGRDENLTKCWPNLLARVAKAAKSRNEIAHASPLVRGGTVKIVVDRETRETLSVQRTEKDRMELRKRTKAGETIWTLDQMFDEYRRTEVLFSNLIAFVKLLEGQTPPPHLLEGMDN